MEINLNNHFEVMELLFDAMPFVFWKNREGIYFGGNLNQAQAFGFKVAEEFIGKNIFEIFDKKTAQIINDNDNKIMNSGLWQTVEETIGANTYLSQKHPIKDSSGNIVGLLGFSLDVTKHKIFTKLQQDKIKKLDNENLKFENKMQGLKIKIEEQTKFIEVINQINHDIMSPLASLKILTHVFAKFLPEEQCETYVRAIQRLAEIAGSMLNYFRFDNHLQIENKALLLVSVELILAIAAKKYEYSARQIKFNIHVANSFSCLSVGILGFNRMISNIINNAVDAKVSTIDIELARVKNKAQIIIKDNGCGMAENVKNKILASIAVTDGKAHGRGIGYSQISQALTQNDGKLHIDSEVGLGTKVTITLPITPTPKWLVSKIV